jgi:hypothetical protein
MRVAENVIDSRLRLAGAATSFVATFAIQLMTTCGGAEAVATLAPAGPKLDPPPPPPATCAALAPPPPPM